MLELFEDSNDVLFVPTLVASTILNPVQVMSTHIVPFLCQEDTPIVIKVVTIRALIQLVDKIPAFPDVS